MSTAYEQYRAKRLSDPEFMAWYEQKRAEIDGIDTILSHIEERREELGLTKADVAHLLERVLSQSDGCSHPKLESNPLHSHEARLRPRDGDACQDKCLG